MKYNKIEKKSTEIFNMNGGVLIIGSLLWDTDILRENWRQTCLQTDNKVRVAAPIRYGRVSKDRHCTFSMVFSNQCNDSDLQGKAFFVPFRDNPVDIMQLQFHALELIKSEHKKPSIDFSIFNWGWGTLTIAVNPELLDEKSEKNAQVKLLLDFWAKQYGNGFDPNQYKAGEETPIVNSQGVLSFTWTNELKDFDFLISAATKSERGAYPTAKEIADRIIVNEYSEYFDKNVEYGITTFQDDEISGLLKKE